MSDDRLVNLLVAAMQRHITWAEPSDGVRMLTLDQDINYVPPFNANPGLVNQEQILDKDDLAVVLSDPDFDPDSVVPVVDSGAYFVIEDRQDNEFVDNLVVFRASVIDGRPALQGVPFWNIASSGAYSVRDMTLFMLLAVIAIEDAKAGNRPDDAAFVLEHLAESFGKVPVVSLSERQQADIVSHIGEEPPIIVRTSKEWTAAMGADSHTAKFVDNDGRDFTTAILGRENDGSPHELVMYADSGAPLVADAGTNKLLTHLNELITRDRVETGPDKVVTVTTSYADILEERGLPLTKKNKERVRAQFKALANTRWNFIDAKGTEWDVGIADAVGYRRDGTIVCSLTPLFVALVIGSNAGRVAVDRLLMTIDDASHPHAFAISYRLTHHMYMNHGSGNEYRISVKKLLENVRSIPDYDHVSETGRAYTRRIIAPLERDLDHLVDIGFLDFWDFVHEKGEPLTDDEQTHQFTMVID